VYNLIIVILPVI